ncbi:MAG: hypothetical protein M0C28_27335 [Candidatus Moduliflexus flocculans]|nr:hypothetical protein [Candidatus Moduliflexus flocculans]
MKPRNLRANSLLPPPAAASGRADGPAADRGQGGEVRQLGERPLEIFVGQALARRGPAAAAAIGSARSNVRLSIRLAVPSGQKARALTVVADP